MISIILLCSCFLFSQNIIDISSISCDSEQRNINIPILGGNLKPEFQPPWDDSTYLNKLNALEIQMLRWPGAEASNFFSWHSGTFIPCYKWEEAPCIPHNSAQSGSSYCQDPICESNGVNYYARDYQTDVNGDSTLLDGCSKSVNISSNFASNYIKATQEDLQKQLFPLFVLNVLSPDYYHIDQDFIDNHIDSTTCAIVGNGTYDEGEEFEDLNANGVYDDGEEFSDAYPTKVNSIQAQIDSICYVIEEFDIDANKVHIQLSNEPWHNQDYKFDIWQNGGDYAQDMIEAAEIIRATSCGINVKIGLSGDVHSFEICNDGECDPDNNPNDRRCNWNQLMWEQITSEGKQDLFDAVSFQEYGGIRKMKIPNDDCFDLVSGELNGNCDLEEDDVWRNVRWLNDDIDSTDYGFLFREFGEQAGGTPPSTDPEYNTIIMNYFNQWLPLQVDRNLNTLNGEAIDWEDEETIEQCGDGYDGLYPELLHNFDKEVWITEYEPLLLDGENLYLKPYQGGWPHAILFLYSTLGYITETSNLKVLINNNVNGFAGNYRLIDSYSYADNVIGTNQCRYICDGGGCDGDDERDLCKNKYPSLSPKGELMRLLNQLAWKNNQIEKINFGEEIGTTHIKRFDFLWNYYPKDLYGWKFSDNGTYTSSDDCLEASDHDYLFINVSENEYHINFDDCDSYEYQVKKSNNMFAKNYHHVTAETYTTVPYPDQDDHVVFTWEFTEQADYNNSGGLFEGTDRIGQDSGLINSNSEDSVLVIPPSSVVQVMYQGPSNGGNCTVDMIQFSSNWNLISFDVESENNMPEEMFEDQIANNNLIVITGYDEGAQYFDPNQPSFLNTLTSINAGYGYWVKLINQDIVSFSGIALNSDYTISLDPDWNLISYWMQESQSIEDAFSGLVNENNLVVATGYDQGAQYFDPDQPSFLNTLTTLNNGFGYWVKVNEAVDGFQYPEASGGSAKTTPRETNSAITKTNVFMFANGSVSFDYTEHTVGEMVNITTESGLLVGEMEILENGYLMTGAIYGDDLTTEVIDGALEDEALIFTYNEQASEPLYVSFTGNMELKRVDLTFKNLPQTFSLHQNYPNPFNPITSLRYDLPEQAQVTLTIYDLIGREVTQLVNTTQEPGFKSVQWNATDMHGKPVSAGVYLYQIRAGEFVQTRKMVLLK